MKHSQIWCFDCGIAPGTWRCQDCGEWYCDHCWAIYGLAVVKRDSSMDYDEYEIVDGTPAEWQRSCPKCEHAVIDILAERAKASTRGK